VNGRELTKCLLDKIRISPLDVFKPSIVSRKFGPRLCLSQVEAVSHELVIRLMVWEIYTDSRTTTSPELGSRPPAMQVNLRPPVLWDKCRKIRSRCAPSSPKALDVLLRMAYLQHRQVLTLSLNLDPLRERYRLLLGHVFASSLQELLGALL
jgi:hypothetical protein